MIKYLVVLTVLLAWGYSSPIKQEKSAPCQVCHPVDPNKLNVHLIPHSHDDVGWLNTVDQYYYGMHTAGVQYIISSTVESLKANSDRRYIQVETAFFWKWWQHQPDNIRQDFADLVNNGQIEMINGAWSMNDEAAANYHSTIDQFTYGLRTINETVGVCGSPRIGWQIDPFGHSREQASIFARLGYDAVMFGRLDYNDKNQRVIDKNMEVIWQGSASLDNANIFTTILPDGYGYPAGFCFDINCGDEVIVDDIRSPDYNVPRKVEDFANKMIAQAAYYRTNNLITTMGTDFTYQAAEKNFVNIDKLIDAFKDHDQINLIYSTPSCYIQAVNDAATANNIEFTVKVDDFFPYASETHRQWTGYFTSRPNSKRFERQTHNIMQAAKQLISFSKINGVNHEDDLTLLNQALGVFQHHDAITGTAKEAVSQDYTRLLTKSITNVEPTLNVIVTDLLKKDPTSDINLNLQPCLLSNISICEATNSDRFVVSAYNPLGRPVTNYVRVPVQDGTYTVTGPDGEISTQLVDSITSFSYVDQNVGTPKPKELVFASNVPGLGLQLYYVERTALKSKKNRIMRKPQTRFGTETTAFEIDEQTGLLSSVTMNGQTHQIKQEFIFYYGFNGDNHDDDHAASGAYIFRPLDNTPRLISDTATVTSTTGDLVDEVRQQFNGWVTQIIRVYKGADNNYIEFDWLVGPIEVDFENGIGREIVSRFTIADFDNGESFYTDSNGREMIKRQVNQRYDYQYDSTLEPVASNYYPITSKIVIKDEAKNLEVAVLNDRAQGGSSLQNGVVEIMVHRRLLMDDAKGVGEGLDDYEFNQGVVARGQHYLIIGSADVDIPGGKSTAAQERELALEKLLTPLVLLADASSPDLSLSNIQSVLNFNFNGLQATLPDNVHILSLEPWQDNTYILRLEHILESNEDATLSQSVSVDLQGLFTLFEISAIRETTLAANQRLDEVEAKDRYVWKTSDGRSVSNNKPTEPDSGNLIISLSPMQTRTFVIEVTSTL